MDWTDDKRIVRFRYHGGCICYLCGEHLRRTEHSIVSNLHVQRMCLVLIVLFQLDAHYLDHCPWVDDRDVDLGYRVLVLP